MKQSKVVEYLAGVSRNVKTLLLVSVIFGGTFGLYEFVLPLYLDKEGISFKGMGFIFSIASLGMFIGRIYIGNMSDLWGRKPFYSLALLACCLVCFFTPMATTLLPLIILRTLWDSAVVTRATMHPILLYEDSRSRFMDFLGKTRGMEFLFQAAGTFLAGATAVSLGYKKNMWIAGGAMLAAWLLFAGIFREQKGIDASQQKVEAKSLLGWRELSYNLKVIIVAYFIFMVGLRTSHSFIMPLFFTKKFGVTAQTVSWVMVIHRLTIATPMLFIGHFSIKNLKATYIGAVLLQGLSIAVSALIPNFVIASAVWLIHDFVGAGVWIPIQNEIIQRYSREGARGLDVSKTLAFSSLGGTFGFILAGYLAPIWISGPFLVSGLVTIASAFVLFKLSLKEEANTQ